MNIQRLLIINRGEIAVRIIRTAKEMGITSVLAVSTADKNSLAALMADEVTELGSPQPSKSYLNQEAIIEVAKKCQVDAIHPGYGFLAENAIFAKLVASHGFIFVGPEFKTIELMGDKASARNIAIKAGVPVVPGSNGTVTDVKMATMDAEKIGYPLLIKSSAGGGGKGIRIITAPELFEDAFLMAQQECMSAFGSSEMYIEKFIPKARHIEVQIIADGENVVHLYERECSLQRNRQKVWEEAPASILSNDIREKLCQSAVSLARYVNYQNVGTVEFLYDELSDEFYFIEMNTRIQVEHPITEMITGIDIVREMLRIASGEKIKYKQSDIGFSGFAIECRINAEDPNNNFLPNIGKIKCIEWPQGIGVRVDTMLYQGYEVPPFYDSMLGKVIIWDNSRSLALQRLARALSEIEIEGVQTNLPLHLKLLSEPAIIESKFHTNYLESYLSEIN